MASKKLQAFNEISAEAFEEHDREEKNPTIFDLIDFVIAKRAFNKKRLWRANIPRAVKDSFDRKEFFEKVLQAVIEYFVAHDITAEFDLDFKKIVLISLYIFILEHIFKVCTVYICIYLYV